ncbi:MAG: VOC family protein [Chloroflexi bacterium]|nr:VOC family protein [Chloroflexota bacterium]
MSDEREIVKGIGGVFIHADDPAALAAWYEKHLGITTGSYDGTYYHVYPWRRDDAPDARLTTTWAIFPNNGERVLPTPRSGIVNYHVDDLDALLGQLREAGIEAEDRSEETYGRFARITDPEGNRIELYQELEAQA